MRYILSLVLLIAPIWLYAQTVAVLQYSGGGDWYANPTSVPNLIAFANEALPFQLNPQFKTVKPSNSDLIEYPFIHVTGHGNITLSQSETRLLREYLLAGGFLHIDDNYGMDPYVRTVIKQLFPDEELVEIPFSHPIYQTPFQFDQGLPKVHEHDGKEPIGLGILKEGRLVLFYSYESDLGDGWEDPAVHNDPQEVRLEALKMGVNLLYYAFTGGKELSN